MILLTIHPINFHNVANVNMINHTLYISLGASRNVLEKKSNFIIIHIDKKYMREFKKLSIHIQVIIHNYTYVYIFSEPLKLLHDF